MVQESFLSGDAIAIINESIGIDQPAVGEVIPGRPLTPVANRAIVTSNITANTTWSSDSIYELRGGISVTNGATLTIQAGTRIEGDAGAPRGRGSGPLCSARRQGRRGRHTPSADRLYVRWRAETKGLLGRSYYQRQRVSE